MYPGLLCRGFI